jgi:hypothetical protein
MRTLKLSLVATLSMALFVVPASADQPTAAAQTTDAVAAPQSACAKAFDKVLTQRLGRIADLGESTQSTQTLQFATEVQNLWALMQAHQATGCDMITTANPMQLSVQDGWRVYQAICTNTLDRRLKNRLGELRTHLRARRHMAVRKGVMALAGELSRDPQYAECQGLTARLDKLMANDLPSLMHDVIRAEANGRAPVTANAK